MNIKEIFKKLKEHAPYILSILILTLICVFYFLNSNIPMHDITTTYFPIAETLKISALEYKDFWPLWTPYGFSGDPFLMKPTLGLDSLLGILILTIPNTAIALKLTYVLLFLISGVSMYALMIYLGIDKKFAFISSLIYILNAHMSKLLVWGWLTTLGGYALLPLAFLFGIKSTNEKEWIKNSIITGIILTVLFRFNPDTKVTIWFGLLFGVYLLFNFITKPSKKRLTKTVLVSLLITLIFFGLSAQRMIPNMDFIKMSSRAETSWQVASSRQLEYKDVFNRLIEPIYKGMPQINRIETGDHIGIIAFLIILYAIYRKRNNRYVLFFSLGALLSVMIATNTFRIYYLLWKFVPFFKSLRYMDRSLFLFVFCCSVLVGFGAKEILERIKKYPKLTYSLLVALIILNLGVFSNTRYTTGNPKEWLNAYEVIKNNYVLQDLSQKEGLFRIQTWETHGIDWGTDFYNVPLKLEHIYRYDTMWYPPYMNVYLSVAYNDPAKFWGILNLKYVTAKTELNVSGFELVKKFPNCTVCFPQADLWAKAWGPYLYENKKFLPRAYIVNNSVLVVGEDEAATQTIYGLMLNQNFNPRNTVIIRGKKSINDHETEELKKYSAIFLVKGSIDQSSIFKLQQYVSSGGILLPDVTKNKNSLSEDDINQSFNSFKGELTPIKDFNIVMHNFDKREIKLNGEREFLVYSEKFSVYAGWNLIVDKKEKREILNANAMISAIYLEGNEKSLVFEYKPKSSLIGLIITIVTLAIIVSFLLFKVLKRKRPYDENPEDI